MCSLQQESYKLAYKLVCEQLAGMDMEEQCRRSGAQYVSYGSEAMKQSPTKIIIEYLNRAYLITFGDIEVSLASSNEEVPLKDKILILRYLTSAKGTLATGKLITFKQLPGVVSYFPVFSQRTIGPLLNCFGKEPELLIDTAAKLRGYKANYGDVSVTINAFPRVPITIALWRGDDEFPSNGSIMFDANISDYLSIEDICVLCETITWRLIRSLR